MAGFRGNDWTERYMITTSAGRGRGEVWSREKLLTETFREARKSTRPMPGGQTLKERPVREVKARIEAVLDDDAFMRQRAGEIPARVMDAVLDRVWDLYWGDHQGRAAGRTGPKDVEAAVAIARLYQGSMDLPIRTQQRFYARLVRAVNAVANRRNAAPFDIFAQVNEEASRRGALIPRPGKDY
jgi:hypothetical protein